MIYILPKRPFRDRIRWDLSEYLNREQRDEILFTFLSGLNGTDEDIRLMQDIAYGDLFFQGHHEPYGNDVKDTIYTTLFRMRIILYDMIQLIHGYSVRLNYLYTDTPLSFGIEVME